MGAKKKSKKQIEEEKALAEAERKAQEELERKRQEEEERKRKEEEERRRKEEEKRRQEELVRLKEQAPFVAERDAAMIDKRFIAQNSRKKDLDDKYLACDPLPDPENEKDLTTFITLWKEAKDPNMREAVDNCQTAENVIKSINLIYCEALAQYDYAKIEWCKSYINTLRGIIIHKYDEISTQILTYIEKYTKYTEEELIELQQNQTGKRVDASNTKSDFTIQESSPDIQFGIWANVLARSVTFRKIAFDYVQCAIPRPHQSQHLIMRCMWTSFDYVSGDNLKNFDYITVGGVQHCRMFQYPELPKQTTAWTMRKIQSIDNSLKCIPFPDPASSQIDDVKAIYKLPEYVFTTEKDEIKVGVWDEETKAWSTDYIEDLQFDRTKRELEFSTRKFAPIAYLQLKTTDYPYDSWYLRCIDTNVGLLSIVTKRIQIRIEIHPLFVKLVEMDQPELQYLVNKEIHPGMLLMELSKCGIHMLPEDEDAERGGIHLKDKATEERAILDIAQTLKVFAFQSVKWGQKAAAENIVVRLRENPDNDRVFLEDDESDWKYIMWWNDKVSYIKARNCDPTFNPEIAEGQATHSMLSLAVKGQQSEDAVERCQYYHDIDFIDNVMRTLRLLRLLAFTTDAYDKRSLEEQQQ